ncbi:MAG: ATP synthase F0 subunit B [Oscillibacter sp.]|nr:ATP synthase F0 subunit B [Oscillibacter sp.]
MNIPLNIDWQQILLHWMNLAILTGGLYFLLFKPVKQFMDKRAAHYQALEDQAAAKLKEAEELKAAYQAKLDGAEEEIHQARAKAQAAVQQSVEEQMAQARQIAAKAQAEAEHSRERILKDSQRELRELAAEAVKKLTARPNADPFDEFLNLAEGGGNPHEKR